ncbi:mechanosensitive ion channel family protein [Alteromonas oceanisediminis]|uniref:mechanosensitive ion channel family protein n=1 Tax=Alteromonas oceanisediminis TaxID=2836180 RepID=UPI001BDA4999|nr:mechanosensitive ion channel family protein [Alteromonas oceanisediminis]MBT0586675.1 mechanosensitive ion channel family protein [Alteromonas oceanisediminis]
MEFKVVDKFWSLINEKLELWIELGIKHLPNIVVAIFIAILFGILSRLGGRVIKNLLRKSFESQQIADLLTAILKVLIIAIGVFIALEFVGLTGTVTSLLAGAGIIGLAIGFAFQDMTENLIAGVAMGIRKPFELGDVIEADHVFGNVRAINLRNTLVETFYGQIEVVPNKILFRNILTNYSTTGRRKIEVPVGISYADDIEKAVEVIVEALNQKDYVIRSDETAVYAKEFGDSSINLLVWFWIKYPGDVGFMQARHDAVVAVNNALKEADILIPFPIRTLDFGAKGGEKLNTMIGSGQNKESQSSNRSEQSEQADQGEESASD